MRRLKKSKYKFDVKKIDVESKKIQDRDISASELFDEIVKSKSRRRHR